MSKLSRARQSDKIEGVRADLNGLLEGKGWSLTLTSSYYSSDEVRNQDGDLVAEIKFTNAYHWEPVNIRVKASHPDENKFGRTGDRNFKKPESVVKHLETLTAYDETEEQIIELTDAIRMQSRLLTNKKKSREPQDCDVLRAIKDGNMEHAAQFHKEYVAAAVWAGEEYAKVITPLETQLAELRAKKEAKSPTKLEIV